jgi:hypothetical protein
VDAFDPVAGERDRFGFVEVRQQDRLELGDVLDAQVRLQRQFDHGGLAAREIVAGSEALTARPMST